jgi:hypothetical protein
MGCLFFSHCGACGVTHQGANIAMDIGKEQLSEATIGYSILRNAQVTDVQS